LQDKERVDSAVLHQLILQVQLQFDVPDTFRWLPDAAAILLKIAT